MNKYDIEIEEVLRKVIQNVEAKDIEEAINIVNEKYNNEDIVLDSSDFVESDIRNLYSKNLNKDMNFYIKYNSNDGILTIIHDDHKEGKYVCDSARDISRCFENYILDYIEDFEITSDIKNKEYEEELERE